MAWGKRRRGRAWVRGGEEGRRGTNVGFEIKEAEAGRREGRREGEKSSPEMIASVGLRRSMS